MNKKALGAFEEIWKDFHFKNHNRERYLRSVIVKALKPPTAEEVCKALIKYFEKPVYFENLSFFVQHYKRKQSYKDYSLNVYRNGKLKILYDLPPHLVTLIGRFYEGLR